MNFWRFEISLAMCKQRRLNAGPLFCGANSSVGKEFATGRSNGSQKGNPRSSFFQQMLNSIRSSESSVPQDLLEVVESSNSEKQRWDPMGWMTLRGFAMDFWLDFKGNFELKHWDFIFVQWICNETLYIPMLQARVGIFLYIFCVLLDVGIPKPRRIMF